MRNLVTRFHLLLLAVTVAIGAVGFLRIPADFQFPAHWAKSGPDWLWPRETLLVAPALEVLLLAAFFAIGRSLTKNHFSKTQHILDPALTLLLAVATATQFGLLFIGIGSDLDFLRLTGFALGAMLICLGVVLFEAERHTYAGLRLPWHIREDRAWRLLHHLAGLAFGLAGLAILLVAWLQPDPGPLVLSFAAGVLLPPLCAGLASALHPHR